jgi:hypothetical protein
MIEWVHLSPVILTDAIYFANIGNPLYTGTAAQRANAYLIAEQAVIQELRTPLLPTTITGTYMWPLHADGTIMLEHQRINSIDRVAVLYGGGTGTCGLQVTEGCYRLREGVGYVDLHCVGELATAQCGCGIRDIYQVQLTYTAGLPTGVAADDSSLHLALSKVAEQFLNEIIDPGANPGGPGAPGVMGFGGLGYREQYNPKSLQMTPMGASASMNMVKRLLKHLKKKRALKFR